MPSLVDMILVFLNLLKFHLWPKMWSIAENFSCALWQMCILLHLDGISWRYQWDPFHLMYHLRRVSFLILSFEDLFIGVTVVLKSPTLLFYSQFLLLCLLVFVLCVEVHLCWMQRYLQLLWLHLVLIPWPLCSVLPYLL